MSSLPDRQKAAVLMLSLTPEASACLFREMSHDVVASLSRGTVSVISPPVRAQVLQEFLSSWRRLTGGKVHDLAHLAQVAQDHPGLVVRVLRKTWPGLYREVMQRRSRVLRHPSKLP